MAGTRRSKKEVIAEKINKIDLTIASYNDRISKLHEDKNKLEKELAEINSIEAKAKEEAEMKEIIKMIKKKNISADELRVMLETAATKEETTEE